MSNGQANDMPNVEIVDEVANHAAQAATTAAGRMLDDVVGSAHTNSRVENDANTDEANTMDMSPGEGVGQAVSEGAGRAVSEGAKSLNELQNSAGEGSSVLESIGEKLDSIHEAEGLNKLEDHLGSINRAEEIGKFAGQLMSEKFSKEVTDKDRERAKEKLSEQLGEFVDEDTRNKVLGLENALIDGDLEAFAKGLQEMKPEERAKFIDGINKQFDKAEVKGGIDLAMDAEGNVLVYEEDGYTALSINPETGESSVKPIEVQPDGSVVLKPGEVINRDAADVMSGIADEATRSLTRKVVRDFPIIRPYPSKPDIWNKPYPGPKGDAGSGSILRGSAQGNIQQRLKDLEGNQ